MSDKLITLSGSVELTAGAEGKGPKVSVLAYSGGQINVGWYGPVIVDLAKLSLPPTVPLLGDHDSTLSGVAGQGEPRVQGGKLTIEGTLAQSSATGKQIIDLSREGIKLQASVGIAPTKRTRIREGESVTVNGRSFTASADGLTVVEGNLREISILPLGADPSTSVHVAARRTTMGDESEVDPVAEERSRVKSIRQICRGEYPRIEAQAIDEGWTVDRTSTHVLAELRAGRHRPADGTAAPRQAANGKPGDTLLASVLLMAGKGELVAKFLPHGEMLANSTPRPNGWPELAATALRLEGHAIPTDRVELVRAAFSTGSMPQALGAGIQKIALNVFLESSKNYLPISRIVPATNFRPGKAVRLAGKSRFEQVPPTGELKHGVIGEDAFGFKIDTYGKIFGIDRQDIINDDLGILTDIPTLLGGEGSRSVSDLFFGVLVANAGAWYSGPHGNLLTATPLDVAGLGKAVQTLRTKKDADNRIIGFVPTVLLVPAALEVQARSILFSTSLARVASGDLLPTSNPLEGLDLTLVVEPRLDANSATSWYLFARPTDGALLLATLNGQLGPIVEEAPQPANMLGMQWRAYMDFGVSLAEWRASVKST